MSVAPLAGPLSTSARAELAGSRAECQAGLLEAVLEARSTLKLDAACLDGPEAPALLRALARKQGDGVRVQILALEGRQTQAAVEQARAAGLLVRTSPASALWTLLVADDRIALLAQGRLRLAGEAAWELGRAFNQAWLRSGGHPASLPERPPVLNSLLRSRVRLGLREQGHRSPKAVLMAALSAAEHSVDVGIEALTDGEVIACLTSAVARGVTVRVLRREAQLTGTDRLFNHQAETDAALLTAGIAVRSTQAEWLPLQGAMIDEGAVLVGLRGWRSDDFRSSAEGLIEVREGLALAQLLTQFEQAWVEAIPASLPSPARRRWARVAAIVRPALQALSQLAARDWRFPEIYVGVTPIAGRWRVLAETR
ncbi:MAG: phospholipase D-like domain-containing protein [Candidatus Sericytochromatia bacterium]|nr:phospholipase D-like domain-containing protein [Candidatus Sericytochromatia bacterium]